MRIPIDDAIEQIIDAYRMWLEESPDNVERQWLKFFDQRSEAVEEGEEIVLEVDA